MKWSVQQLRKIQNFPFHFSSSIDWIDEFANVSDLRRVESCEVDGFIDDLGDDRYRLKYHLKCLIIMECAVCLEDAPYLIEGDYDEIYAVNPADDEFPIEKNTLDVKKSVYSNIIIDKPLKVVRDDAYDILKSKGLSLDEEILLDQDEEIISYSDLSMTDEEEDS